jgi:DNA-binding PadR family transcriptional regulator
MRTYLGEFEQLLLLALVHLDEDDAYGTRIRAEIEARTGRAVSPGAIYTALDRLERRRLVISRLGDPTPQRGGKRKRHYRLQPAGVELLGRTQEALARMANGPEFLAHLVRRQEPDSGVS